MFKLLCKNSPEQIEYAKISLTHLNQMNRFDAAKDKVPMVPESKQNLNKRLQYKLRAGYALLHATHAKSHHLLRQRRFEWHST